MYPVLDGLRDESHDLLKFPEVGQLAPPRENLLELDAELCAFANPARNSGVAPEGVHEATERNTGQWYEGALMSVIGHNVHVRGHKANAS
eukprot:685706-Pyramimonas_sp.AAC.1